MLTNHNDVNGRHCSQCDRRQTEATLLSRGASYENVSGTSQETPPHPLSRKQQWNRTNRRAYSPHPYAFHHCSCSCSSSSHSSRSNLLYVEVNKARGEALVRFVNYFLYVCQRMGVNVVLVGVNESFFARRAGEKQVEFRAVSFN